MPRNVYKYARLFIKCVQNLQISDRLFYTFNRINIIDKIYKQIYNMNERSLYFRLLEGGLC